MKILSLSLLTLLVACGTSKRGPKTPDAAPILPSTPVVTQPEDTTPPDIPLPPVITDPTIPNTPTPPTVVVIPPDEASMTNEQKVALFRTRVQGKWMTGCSANAQGSTRQGLYLSEIQRNKLNFTVWSFPNANCKQGTETLSVNKEYRVITDISVDAARAGYCALDVVNGDDFASTRSLSARVQDDGLSVYENGAETKYSIGPY